MGTNGHYKVLAQEPGVDQAANDGRAEKLSKNDIFWYGPYCTSNISQQKLNFEHFLSRAVKHLSYFKRSSFTAVVNTEKEIGNLS